MKRADLGSIWKGLEGMDERKLRRLQDALKVRETSPFPPRSVRVKRGVGPLEPDAVTPSPVTKGHIVGCKCVACTKKRWEESGPVGVMSWSPPNTKSVAEKELGEIWAALGPSVIVCRVLPRLFLFWSTATVVSKAPLIIPAGRVRRQTEKLKHDRLCGGNLDKVLAVYNKPNGQFESAAQFLKAAMDQTNLVLCSSYGALKFDPNATDKHLIQRSHPYEPKEKLRYSASLKYLKYAPAPHPRKCVCSKCWP